MGNGGWRWVPRRQEWVWRPDFDGPEHPLEEDVEWEGDRRVVRERSCGGWMVYFWEVWGGSGMEEGWRRRGSSGAEDGRPSAVAVAWAAWA